jgi:uncharacterized protein (TIGR01777 family)
MLIAITGGSGFVGKALTEHLLSEHHEVVVLTRDAKKTVLKQNVKVIEWLTEGSCPEKELEGIDAIINLAGQSINARWTNTQKKAIFESRIKATAAIQTIITKLSNKPKVIINASAVGIYGTSLSEEFSDISNLKQGNDFLANTVIAWEEAASKIEQLGIRTVTTRFGVVLGNAGALQKMVFPYKIFAGGTIGSGKQWVSWIHIKDVVRIIEFAITHAEISGPLNVTSPFPETMKQFGITIGKTLGRPHWLPVPSIALKILFGEMSTLVLKGQKVSPEKLIKNGYEFSFSHLEDALSDILKD